VGGREGEGKMNVNEREEKKRGEAVGGW